MVIEKIMAAFACPLHLKLDLVFFELKNLF